MSLQDDYFELSESLSGHKLEKLNRIWEAFCEMDAEHDDLLRIKNSVRNLLTLCQQEKPQQKPKKETLKKNYFKHIWMNLLKNQHVKNEIIQDTVKTITPYLENLVDKDTLRPTKVYAITISEEIWDALMNVPTTQTLKTGQRWAYRITHNSLIKIITDRLIQYFQLINQDIKLNKKHLVEHAMIVLKEINKNYQKITGTNIDISHLVVRIDNGQPLNSLKQTNQPHRHTPGSTTCRKASKSSTRATLPPKPTSGL